MLTALLITLAPGIADAHTKSQSFSTWEWSGQHLTGSFTIDTRRATLLYADAAADTPLPALLEQHLAGTVTIKQAGRPCELTQPPQTLPAAAGWQRVALRFGCPESIDNHPAELRIDALFRYAATHLHLLRVTQTEPPLETVLTAQRPSITLGDSGGHTDFFAFVRIGAEHVASGWDHIAFLAALLLLIPGWSARLWTVTGFTLGHSVTLGLAVTGRLQPDSTTVEALIGFSVAYAALEAARRRALLTPVAQLGITVALLLLGAALLAIGLSALSVWTWLACGLLLIRLLPATAQHRSTTGPAIAAAFGLVHGAGFAGALLDLSWPADQLLPILAGFNIGVELGQIGIVVVLALAGGLGVRTWQRLTRDREAVWPQTIAAGLLCLAGVQWFVARAVIG